jgi:hypothetical protein
LVQLILDPYYRTYKGFLFLVDKEWSSLGYVKIRPGEGRGERGEGRGEGRRGEEGERGEGGEGERGGERGEIPLVSLPSNPSFRILNFGVLFSSHGPLDLLGRTKIYFSFSCVSCGNFNSLFPLTLSLTSLSSFS